MLQTLTLESGGQRFVLAGDNVARVIVRQTGSPIRDTDRKLREATLAGLRLGKIDRLSILEDSPAVRGMLQKVEHLVCIVARDIGPLPVNPRRGRANEGPVASDPARLGDRVAVGTVAAGTRFPDVDAGPSSKRTRPVATQERNALTVPRDESGRPDIAGVRRRLADAVPLGEGAAAIREAGEALRSSRGAVEMTNERASRERPTMHERLGRRDLEHDLLNLLFSDDRDLAWDAAREIAASFSLTSERFRLTQERDSGDVEEGEVLEAVVEILKAEGQRYFSLLRYDKKVLETGIHLEGSFAVSRALPFGSGRFARLPDGDVPPDLTLLVYADGGIRAEDVSPDDDLQGDDFLLARRFSLDIPEARAGLPLNVSFVVPGLLVDTLEIT